MRKSLTITYTQDSSSIGGDGTYCVVESLPFEDETAKLNDAAALLDAAFNKDPCTGEIERVDGEEEELFTEPTLTEEEFWAASALYAPILACVYHSKYIAHVEVYRSNRSIPYKIVTDLGEILTSKTRRDQVGSKKYTMELDYTLAAKIPYPIYRGDNSWENYTVDVEVIEGEVYGWTISDNHIKFSEPSTGVIEISHHVKYDTVFIEVPCDLSEENWTKPRVIVFYDKLAYDTEVDPPEIDRENLNLAQIDCRGYEDYDIDTEINLPDDDSECWKDVNHYDKCKCSGDHTNTHRERHTFPCSQYFTIPTWIWDGYIFCPEEEEDVHDPVFYEETCCEPPPNDKGLPFCRKYRDRYLGGAAPVDVDLYDSDYYEFIPVHPEQGFCGDFIREWDVDALTCCDFPDEIYGGSTLNSAAGRIWGGPLSVSPPGEVDVSANPGTGAPPFSWGVDGKGVSASPKSDGNTANVKVNDCFCKPAVVYAKDTCNWYMIGLVWPSGGSWESIDVTRLESPYKWHHNGDAYFYVHGFNGDRTEHSVQSYAQDLVTPVGTGGADPTAEEIEAQLSDVSGLTDYQTDSIAAVPENLDGFQESESTQVWYKEHPFNPGQYIRYYAYDGVNSIRYSEEFTEPVTCDNPLEVVSDQGANAPVVADWNDVLLRWQNGTPPYELVVEGEEVYLDSDRTITEYTTYNDQIRVYAKDTCGNSNLYVTDFCGEEITINFRATDGHWANLYYNPDGGGVHGSIDADGWNYQPYAPGCPEEIELPEHNVYSLGTTYPYYTYGSFGRYQWRPIAEANQTCPHSFYGRYCRGIPCDKASAEARCSWCYGIGPSNTLSWPPYPYNYNRYVYHKGGCVYQEGSINCAETWEKRYSGGAGIVANSWTTGGGFGSRTFQVDNNCEFCAWWHDISLVIQEFRC